MELMPRISSFSREYPTMTVGARAAVVHQRGGDFAFEDVEIDSPRPDEVLVRMVASGICHTDVAARDGLLAQTFPAVFGHEGAGIVESVGTDVVRISSGDKVVLSFSSCGQCPRCHDGHPAHCLAFDELNFDGARTDGSPTIRDAEGKPVGGCFLGQSSFAYYALTRERNVIPVETADNDELAMLASLGCGVQAGSGTVLNELRPQPDESVAVFGAGTVGLSAVMAARLIGASPIVAVDIVPSRLELARELGATFTINGRDEDVGSRLRKIAGDVDHAVETTGFSRVIDQAIRSLGPRGSASLLGISADDTDERVSPVSPGPNQTVFYSIAGDSDPHRFIPFLIRCYREGKFPFNKLIREYTARRINEAVRDSIKGITVKPILRF
jgi:aryl-alcohol dehydrogenase